MLLDCSSTIGDSVNKSKLPVKLQFVGQLARVSERNIEPVRAPAGSPGCSRVSGGTLG